MMIALRESLSYLTEPERALLDSLIDPRPTERLLDFTCATFFNYKADPVHALIASELDKVLSGETENLMLNIPPQHGKSELASVHFAAYALAKKPEWPIILASYAAGLAEDKSAQVRDLIRSQEYQALFPGIELKPDSQAKNLWKLDGYRGQMLAVGVDGPVTGHPAMLGLIDDPHENWRQAQSPTMRKVAIDWYRATFSPRVWEGGHKVLTMTRWHEGDLGGYVLANEPGQWKVVRVPAIAETQDVRDLNGAYLGQPTGQPDPLGRLPGEALAPSRFSRAFLDKMKLNLGTLMFGALYDGVPRPSEGSKFKREWFQTCDVVPVVAERVRWWDKAGTEGGGAYTCGVLMAMTADGRYFIEDVIRVQVSDLERERLMKATAIADAQKYGNIVAVWMEQEPGSGGKDSAAASKRNLAGFPVYAETSTGDKEVRATPFAAQCEAYNVWVKRASWNGLYTDELCAFPNSTYKDQVDASSGAFNKLSSVGRFSVVETDVADALAGFGGGY